MRPRGILPLVIGVTGHRDLRAGDRPALGREVRAIFAGIRRRHPNTPFVLLSALAAGADQLVARIAIDDFAAALVAVLPLAPASYERDFAGDDAALAEFGALREAAARVVVMPFVAGGDAANTGAPGDARTRQYAAAGAYIAAHAQVLIALWDGRPAQYPGGTADVVGYRLRGIPEPFAPARSLIDPIEGGIVYHVRTPRASAPADAVPIGTSAIYPGVHRDERQAARDFERVQGRIELFNREQPGADAAGIDAMHDAAEHAAQRNQKRGSVVLSCLYALAFLAVACFDFYSHDPSHRTLLLEGYLVLTLIALCVFGAAAHADLQNRHQDYRALSEALRVQRAWRAAGIGESVAEHYLRRQKSELDWIRQALRYAYLHDELAGAAAAPLEGPSACARIASLRDEWVAGQLAYFSAKGKAAVAMLRALRAAAWTLLGLAIVIAVGLLVSGPAHPSRDALVAIGLSAVAAALLHAFAEKRAYAEDGRRYARMELIYTIAAQELATLLDQTHFDAPAAARARTLVHDLGREALIENAEWVLVHRDRPIEFVIGG